MRLVPVLAVVIALAGCRSSSEEHMRKGNVFFNHGDMDSAQTHYEAALAAQPDNAAAMTGLGNVRYEKSDPKGAIAWYEKAIAADTELVEARHMLAVALGGVGRIDEAIAVLDGAVKVDPNNAFALNALGGLYKRRGDLAKSEALRIAALRADEDYHPARYALANLFIDSGRFEEAERQLSRLMPGRTEPLAEYGFARLAAAQGRFDEAGRRLSRVMELGVSRPRQILADPVFAKGWANDPMKRIRTELQARTQTATSASVGTDG